MYLSVFDCVFLCYYTYYGCKYHFNVFSDFNKCHKLNPCMNWATCIDTPGSYRCECTPQWTGQHCDVGKVFIWSYMSVSNDQQDNVRVSRLTYYIIHVFNESVVLF